MRIHGAADHSRLILNIALCHDQRVFQLLHNDSHMVMRLIAENPVIKDDITRFRKTGILSRMIGDPAVAHGKFLPGNAACQMACNTFVRPDGDFKPRFPAAIVNKRRAP